MRKCLKMPLQTAFSLIVAAGFAVTPCNAAALSSEKLEQLAAFCSAQGAFGQKFGQKADLVSPEPEEEGFAFLFTVKTPPGWEPFTKIRVQQTPQSELVYRIYGTAVLDTPEETRATLNALTAEIAAKGFETQKYPDATGFNPVSATILAPFNGMLWIEGRKLTMNCGDNGLVDQALKEPNKPRRH
jgi:hypothetical protein